MYIGDKIKIGNISGFPNKLWTGVTGKIINIHPGEFKTAYTVKAVNKKTNELKKILLFDGEFDVIKKD